VLKNLRGFTYSEEEMQFAIIIVNKTKNEIDELVYKEFNIEKEENRTELLNILNRFVKNTKPLER
jgi:hypothetical protein